MVAGQLSLTQGTALSARFHQISESPESLKTLSYWRENHENYP